MSSQEVAIDLDGSQRIFPLYGHEYRAVEVDLNSGHPITWRSNEKQTVYKAVTEAIQAYSNCFDYWDIAKGEYMRIDPTLGNIATIAVAAHCTFVRMETMNNKPAEESLTAMEFAQTSRIASSLLQRITEFAGGELSVEDAIEATYSVDDYARYAFPETYARPVIYPQGSTYAV